MPADKELRILLKESYDTTQAHIVTISIVAIRATNTREPFHPSGKRGKKANWTNSSQRQWNEFIFADRFQAFLQFAGKTCNEVIAQVLIMQIGSGGTNGTNWRCMNGRCISIC
ncbi:MAG: hypothetical protein H6577_26310 [Lewinellaceae bacterium]|nr:hypothetical protein [Lewinellaceae bacterium]